MEARTGPDATQVHPIRIRDFRLLWIGATISLLGDQFYIVALPWLVLGMALVAAVTGGLNTIR